jgi:hypothetical protein
MLSGNADRHRHVDLIYPCLADQEVLTTLKEYGQAMSICAYHTGSLPSRKESCNRKKRPYLS